MAPTPRNFHDGEEITATCGGEADRDFQKVEQKRVTLLVTQS